MDYAPGEYRIQCPSCGRGGRDKTAGLTVERDGAVMHCFRCNHTETFRPERGAVDAWINSKISGGSTS